MALASLVLAHFTFGISQIGILIANSMNDTGKNASNAAMAGERSQRLVSVWFPPLAPESLSMSRFLIFIDAPKAVQHALHATDISSAWRVLHERV